VKIIADTSQKALARRSLFNESLVMKFARTLLLLDQGIAAQVRAALGENTTAPGELPGAVVASRYGGKPIPGSAVSMSDDDDHRYSRGFSFTAFEEELLQLGRRSG
jgi:hypothetical protein